MLDVCLLDVPRITDTELDEYHGLRLASYQVDYPELPAPNTQDTLAKLRAPQARVNLNLVWMARRDGRPVAHASASLPEDGNKHLAVLQMTVHPELRRQGIGAELLHVVAASLRDRGRTVVEGWNVPHGGAAETWVHGLGFRFVHTTIFQILDVAEVDRARWNVPVAEGYHLVRWADHAPEDLVNTYAKARAAIGDAPLGESSPNTPDWTVDRVRRAEAEYREAGTDFRTVVAVDAGCEVVGLTELTARPLQPKRLMQGDTAVLAAHRGCGLGLAMKAAMLRWFIADKPAVRQVWTSTGASNTHMAEVNHRLGFATRGRYSVVNRELAGL